MSSLQKAVTDLVQTIPEDEKEYLTIHIERYRRIAEQIERLHLQDKATVLDIGCYPLHLFSVCQKAGFTVSGICSPHEPVTNKSIKALNIETDPFPFPNSHFDLIIFTEVFEHLLDGHTHTLDEIHRVLKPSGFCILTTPNILRIHNLISLLMGKNIYFSMEQLLETKVSDSTIYHRHNREFTLRELTSFLKNSDFRISRAEQFISYTPFREHIVAQPILIRLGKIVIFWLMKVIPRWRDSLCVVFSKKQG